MPEGRLSGCSVEKNPIREELCSMHGANKCGMTKVCQTWFKRATLIYTSGGTEWAAPRGGPKQKISESHKHSFLLFNKCFIKHKSLDTIL